MCYRSKKIALCAPTSSQGSKIHLRYCKAISNKVRKKTIRVNSNSKSRKFISNKQLHNNKKKRGMIIEVQHCSITNPASNGS